MKVFRSEPLKTGEVRLTRFWRTLLIAFTALGLALAINQIFSLQIFGFKPIASAFLYYECAAFLPFVYIIQPNTRKINISDIVLAFLAFAISIYLALTAMQSTLMAWEWFAPTFPTICALMFWALLLEAIRRSGGVTLTIICALFSLFPLISGHLPGFLHGAEYDILTLSRMHVLSQVSIFSVPMQTFGNLLIGFTVFGSAMKVSGCGDFFLDISNSLMGRAAGGPAKVACISSGLLGMVSGSVLTNVMTTGSMTIPSMIRTGYDPKHAAAIEACTSTGATIMPPIMGTAAFLMATQLGVPYAEVALAAIIPAIMYYLALFVQIDSYAMVNNLKASSETISRIKKIGIVMKEGWYFILAFVLLCYLLVVLKFEGWAPYLTAAALLILACIRKETRMNWKRFLALLEDIGLTISNLISLLAGVGLILGSLSITGVALAFSRELVALVGDRPLLILIAGALTCFILGMGMSPSACYIFLAVVMAPAIIEMGFNPIATHLFIFYWGMISNISPPVALAVYGACGISKSNPWKTGWLACRLGIVVFFVPFFFVYNPALIAQGSFSTVIYTAITAMIGTWLLSSGLGSYIRFGGNVSKWWMKTGVIIAGFLMCWPGQVTDIFGIVLAIVMVFLIRHCNVSKNKAAPA